jgi:hypothetical protein
MKSLTIVAGTVIGSIAGFLLLLSPFVVIFFRRRRAFAQRHGAASFVRSQRDVVVGYGKKVIESCTILDTTEGDLEKAPMRQDMVTVDCSPLIDLSSTYKSYPVLDNRTPHHEVTGQSYSSDDYINLGATYEAKFVGSTAHIHSETKTNDTLIDISVDHTSKKFFQKRAEFSEEILIGPVPSGSARTKYPSYTQEEYDMAIKGAATTEQSVSAYATTATKKIVRKRSEVMAEVLDGPVDAGSVHVRGTRHTQEELEQALVQLQK